MPKLVKAPERDAGGQRPPTFLRNPNGQILTSLRSGDPSFDRQERTRFSAGNTFEYRFSDALKQRQNGSFMRV